MGGARTCKGDLGTVRPYFGHELPGGADRISLGATGGSSGVEVDTSTA